MTKDDIQICNKENFKYELPNFDLNGDSDGKVRKNDEEIIAAIVKKVNDVTITQMMILMLKMKKMKKLVK